MPRLLRSPPLPAGTNIRRQLILRQPAAATAAVPARQATPPAAPRPVLRPASVVPEPPRRQARSDPSRAVPWTGLVDFTFSGNRVVDVRDIVAYPQTPDTLTTGDGSPISALRFVDNNGDPVAMGVEGLPGPQGPPGTPGLPGNTGTPGPPNVLNIGTVTTGVPGSSAASTITGTSPTQTLNLTIPRGDTGTTGTTGLPGPPGPGVPAGGTANQALTKINATDFNTQWTTLGGGTGTVTSVSVASANGLAGTVATATSTPAITLSTTITGMLKGNGTAISAAVTNTDYLPAVNPTYTGTLTGGAVTGTTATMSGTVSTSHLTVVASAAAVVELNDTDTAVKKFLTNDNGTFNVVNSAFSTNLFSVTDAGVATFTGALTGTTATFSSTALVGKTTTDTVPGSNTIEASGGAGAGAGIWSVAQSGGGQAAMGLYAKTAGHYGGYLYTSSGSLGLALIDNAGTYAGVAATFSTSGTTLIGALNGTSATFSGTVSAPGILRLYDEQVLASPAVSIGVNVPAGCKLFELHFEIASSNAGVNDNLALRAVVSGTPYVTADQNTQYLTGITSTAGAALSAAQTYYYVGGGILWRGRIRGSLAPGARTGLFMTGEVGLIQVSARITSTWEWDGGPTRSTVTGFQLNSVAPTNFAAGSNVRVLVVT